MSSIQQKAETRQSPVLLPPTLPTDAASTALAGTKPQNPPLSPKVTSATGRESEAETLALDKNSQPQVGCRDCHCARQTRAASVPELQTPCSSNTHPKTLREARLSGTALPTPPGCRETEGAGGGLRVVSKVHPVGTRRSTEPCASCQAPALSLVLQSGQAVPGLLLITPPCPVWLREEDGILAVEGCAVTPLSLPSQACHLQFGNLGSWPGREPVSSPLKQGESNVSHWVVIRSQRDEE